MQIAGLISIMALPACQAKSAVSHDAHNLTNSFTVRCADAASCEGRMIELTSDKLSSVAGKALVNSDGTAVPYQWLDKDKDGQVESLIFEIRDTSVLYGFVDTEHAVKKRVNVVFSVRENGEKIDGKYKGGNFQDYTNYDVPASHVVGDGLLRFEGPTWESELIGYRLYLDERNGTDIFGKRVASLALSDKGYDGDNYHEDKKWGGDILKVGASLGVGALGIFADGQASRLKAQGDIALSVTANGPLSAGVQVSTVDVPHKGAAYDIITTYEILAGSRLTKVTASSDKPLPDWATGVVNHDGTELLTSGNDGPWSYIASYGTQAEFGGDLGVAVFYPAEMAAYVGPDANNHVVKFEGPRKSVQYYMAAVWGSDAGGVKTLLEFKSYLDDELAMLSSPPRIIFEN